MPLSENSETFGYGNYEKRPTVSLPTGTVITAGWEKIGDEIGRAAQGKKIVVLEIYQGVSEGEVRAGLARALEGRRTMRALSLFKSERILIEMTHPDLTDDPTFGFLTRLTIQDFFDEKKVAAFRSERPWDETPLILVGIGASAMLSPEMLKNRDDVLLLYFDCPRTTLQARQRAYRVPGLGLFDRSQEPELLHKRSYFVDWPLLDRLKKSLWPRIDFYFDTVVEREPKMLRGSELSSALEEVARRPFRLAPIFDSSQEGGEWIRKVCSLSGDTSSCVLAADGRLEENSLLLTDGVQEIEMPARNLVFFHPRELLGNPVHARFGAEFPIRFSIIETVGGESLPLHVHPLTGYMQENFGFHDAQDESYYILEACDGASVYLGLSENATKKEMMGELRKAESEPDQAFPVEKYVNAFPAHRHDHFLVPAGTVHRLSAGIAALSVSASPSVFSFNLWGGSPLNLFRASRNIQWDWRSEQAARELASHAELICKSDDFMEERTGLHAREFIETRRITSTRETSHSTGGAQTGAFHMLSLVAGKEIVVTSPGEAFPPRHVHFAETLVVPASVGDYKIESACGGESYTVVKAYVRTGISVSSS